MRGRDITFDEELVTGASFREEKLAHIQNNDVEI